ncbi:SAM-dependent methyltransferase [Pendulispora rubella]|uniref:SAM-dependent methyltransferase n=1 Tax=Pendulispora rubella TaxID=2741070 RepID=A0ABZ2L2R9_9BACT
MVHAFDPSSRSKLTHRDLPRFEGPSLFHAVGRAICEAECLPRKELFEAWEVARRIRRRFRGGRVVDLACGHGLLAHLLLVLDDTSPTAVAADVRIPESAAKVTAAMIRAWPRLAGRVDLQALPMAAVDVRAGDLVVSVHACGALTDDVLQRALAVGTRVAVLPCCQDAKIGDQGSFGGWLDAPLAIDVERVTRLRLHGYTVRTEQIPEAITEKNRLLLAEPPPA